MQLVPPETKETPDAPRQASKKLADMGPMSRDENLMFGTMALALGLWVRSDWHAENAAPIPNSSSSCYTDRCLCKASGLSHHPHESQWA